MGRFRMLTRGFSGFLATLVKRRYLIFEMAKREMMNQHLGSGLGFFWTFINPAIMILILWFVFTVAFRNPPRHNVPFVIWLTAGMAIWNTFAEVVNGSSNIIIANSHLVKKTVFPLSILPVVKLAASFITHSIFLLLLMALIFLYRLPASLYWIQALYYFFAMGVLVLGIGWTISSVNLFSRDMGQVVGVALQFGFWATPIFWDPDLVPARYQAVLRLNPMLYIVQGYRESFIYFVPFWSHPGLTLYYWSFTGLVFVAGAFIFLRLRPHFADVL